MSLTTGRPRAHVIATAIMFAGLVVWELLAVNNSRVAFLYSSPSAIGVVIWQDLGSGELPKNVGVTFAEVVGGLVLGTVLGTAIGLMLWTLPRASGVATLVVSAVGAIPVIALAPMMIMWFGTGVLAKVVMAGIAAFCVSVSQAFAGAKEAAVQYGRLLNALQVRPLDSVRYFLAPAAVSWVVLGARVNISLAIVGAFAGEFISSEVGLGHYVMKAAGLYRTDRVLAGVVAFVAIALVLDRAVARASQWMFPWASPGASHSED